MDAYFVVGSAADPDFTHAELLSDKLIKAHPRIEVTTDMRHPCEWESFRKQIVQARGFSSTGLKAIIWRRDGRLVGSVHDFAKVIKNTYNLELEVDQQLIADITAENLEVPSSTLLLPPSPPSPPRPLIGSHRASTFHCAHAGACMLRWTATEFLSLSCVTLTRTYVL